MVDKKQLAQFADFYATLSPGIVDKSIDALAIPGKAKRDIAHIRSRKEKVKAIASQYPDAFLTFARRVLASFGRSAAEGKSYDEILASFDGETAVGSTLYLITRFAGDEEYTDEMLAQFITSDEYRRTLRREWTDAQEPQPEPEKTPARRESAQPRPVEDARYFGIIENVGSFYNFLPAYKIEDGEPKKVESPHTLFPNYGKICLWSNQRSPEYIYLQSAARRDGVFAVHLTPERLKPNTEQDGSVRKDIQFRLDLNGAAADPEEMRDLVAPCSDFGLYRITASRAPLEDASFTDGIIELADVLPVDTMVMLVYGERLCGPYQVRERVYDKTLYVKPSLDFPGGVVDCYSEADGNCKIYGFTKEFNGVHRINTVDVTGEPVRVDMVSDVELLRQLTKAADLTLLKRDPEGFITAGMANPYLSQAPADVVADRVKRLRGLLTAPVALRDDLRPMVVQLIESMRDDYEVRTGLAAALQTGAASDDELISLREQVSALQAENETLRQGRAPVSAEPVKASADDAGSFGARYADMERRYNEMQEEIDRMKGLYDRAVTIREIDDDISYSERTLQTKQDAVAKLRTQEKQLKQSVGELSGRLCDEIKRSCGIEGAARAAFSPVVAEVLMDAAEQWKQETAAEDYIAMADAAIEVREDVVDPAALPDILVDGVQRFRNYTRNEIINMYICLTHGFITVFAGGPGSGKTSVCDILASSLGLMRFSGAAEEPLPERYISVSVEKGWSSKRDLVGYYNPLTKRYDKSNSRLYDALRCLDGEGADSRFPCIVLLDDANLSSPEYYWSDFMRLSDGGGKYINIGEIDDIYVPGTLRFLATINSDTTTERLTPRFIDRAWVVTLPGREPKEDAPTDLYGAFGEIYAWRDVCEAFAGDANAEPGGLMRDVLAVFAKHGFRVSARSTLAVQSYVKSAVSLLEPEGDAVSEQVAVDFAVTQRLLPMVNGSARQYERLFAELGDLADAKHLTRTRAAIDRMRLEAQTNMGLCRYLA